jgi:hypothetical protein
MVGIAMFSFGWEDERWKDLATFVFGWKDKRWIL